MLNLFEEEINKLQTIDLNEKNLIGGGVNVKRIKFRNCKTNFKNYSLNQQLQ